MRRGILWLAAVCVVLVTPVIDATAAVTCGDTWSVSERGDFQAYWWDIAVADKNHAWAVGVDVNDAPLVVGWDGSAWSNVTPAQMPSSSSLVRAVRATEPTNVWIGGSYFDRAAQTNRALIMHWNGTSWTQEATPDGRSQRITGLWADASGDLWAAGVEYTGGRYVGLVLHRSGTTWERIRVPRRIDHERYLYDISGSSPTDIWAVGYDYDEATKLAVPLMLHWNGSSLSRVPTPKLAQTSNTSFVGVTAVDGSNAWAGGYQANSEQALLERWDGKTWAVVPLLDHTGYEGIQGVDATSTSNAYAVGYRNGHPTIRRWDGVVWKTVDPPWSVGTGIDVTTTANDGTWAVGSAKWEVIASTCA